MLVYHSICIPLIPLGKVSFRGFSVEWQRRAGLELLSARHGFGLWKPHITHNGGTCLSPCTTNAFVQLGAASAAKTTFEVSLFLFFNYLHHLPSGLRLSEMRQQRVGAPMLSALETLWIVEMSQFGGRRST